MLGRLRIGADQAEDPVGLVGIAGPDLLAVDQPMVALVLALGLQRGEVGAGAGLGIALAPADLAARDLGQEVLLLLLGAIFEQRRAEHRDAEAHQRIARADPRHFLLAGSWSRPARGRRRHIPSASRARSSRARPSRSIQCFCASFLKIGLRPPQQASLSSRIGSRISGGQFASSQARVSARNVVQIAHRGSSPLRKRQVPRSGLRSQPASAELHRPVGRPCRSRSAARSLR